MKNETNKIAYTKPTLVKQRSLQRIAAGQKAISGQTSTVYTVT